MLKILAVMAGGSLGAICRHGMFLVVQAAAGDAFPAGTLAVNLLGSFLIGLLWGVFEEMHFLHQWRLFVFTGFLGGFTTFSTYARETMQLFKAGAWKSGLAYVTLSNLLGVLLVVAGYLLSRRLLPALR